MSWTDERVELLKQLWLDGKSASQISSALGAGLTRNAVIGKVHRLGLAGRPKSPASPAQPRQHRPRVAGHRPAGLSPSPRVRTIGNTALALARDFDVDAAAQVDEGVVLPMSLRVTIVELKEAMCKWPLGDPTTSEFRYCGATSIASPYCAYHARIAYQPSQDKRRERAR